MQQCPNPKENNFIFTFLQKDDGKLRRKVFVEVFHAANCNLHCVPWDWFTCNVSDKFFTLKSFPFKTVHKCFKLIVRLCWFNTLEMHFSAIVDMWEWKTLHVCWKVLSWMKKLKSGMKYCMSEVCSVSWYCCECDEI